MHECLEVYTKAYSCFKTGLWLTKTDLSKLRISKSGCFELELVKKCRVKPMTGMCLLTIFFFFFFFFFFFLGSEGNRIYNHQSPKLINNEFRVQEGSVTANSSRTSF
jgi:hypothetical protein